MHQLTDSFIKGRAKYKKITGRYYDKVDKPKAACHLGVIPLSLYGKYDEMPIQEMLGDYPELHNMVPLPCDDLDQKEGWISSILIHLNDDHDGRSGWTDKNVAEWLERALTGASV